MEVVTTNWGIKVVSGRDDSESGICQNPLLASSLEKTFAPVSWASVSSNFGIGWTSRSTFSLRGFEVNADADFAILFGSHHHPCAPLGRFIYF